jgi:hypothetical protein
MVARGATAVAAGLVDLVLLTAAITRQQMSAQRRGPAGHNVIHRTAMTGPEIRAQPLLIGGTIIPENVRHLWHARTPEQLESGHEGVDGGVHNVEGVAREMGGARGGTRAFMPEDLWADAS